MRPGAARRASPSPLVTLISVGALVAISAAETRARPRVPQKAMAKLEGGGVVTYSLPPQNSGGVRIGKAIGIVEGSPEAVVYTLLDADNYAHFVHRVKKAYFVKRHAKGVYAMIETSMPWPVADAWAYVKISYTHLGKRVFRMEWVMRRGTLKQYHASALIEPWDDHPEKCALTYTILAEPKTLVPNSVLSKGTRHVAEMVLHRVRIWVKRKTRERKFPPGLAKRYH